MRNCECMSCQDCAEKEIMSLRVKLTAYENALKYISAGPKMPLSPGPGEKWTPKKIAMYVAQWSQDQAKSALERGEKIPGINQD